MSSSSTTLARNHFIVGTGTGVGKNTIACSMHSLARQRGMRCCPFKPLALDIGEHWERPDLPRWTPAVEYQALSARVSPSVDMNPIRLTYGAPDSPPRLLVRGRAMTMPASFDDVRALFSDSIGEAIRQLPAGDGIIAEGSGSATDALAFDAIHAITAELLDADVHLVANAEAGGAYAQLVGTLELMPPAFRRRVRSLVINRLDNRPHLTLLDSFRQLIADRYGIDVVETIPTFSSIRLMDEERFPTLESTSQLEDEIDFVAGRIAVTAPRFTARVLGEQEEK